MAMIRDHGNIVFECDGRGCLEILETDTPDFEIARAVRDEAGWELRRHNKGEWQNICPDCLDAETSEAFQ